MRSKTIDRARGARGERGILWVGAGSGLYAREPGGRVTRVTVVTSLPANDILSLALDAQSIAGHATPEGLVLLDRDAILRGDRGVVRRVFRGRTACRPRMSRVHVDGDTLWIGTTNGLAEGIPDLRGRSEG